MQSIRISCTRFVIFGSRSNLATQVQRRVQLQLLLEYSVIHRRGRTEFTDNHIPPSPYPETARPSVMPESRSKEPLVWIDCEMTGLDYDRDEIIQIACFITDSNLNLLDTEGFETVVHQSEDTMNAMGDWCTHTHHESGLTAAVLASEITPKRAAEQLLSYVKKHVPESRKALLAGNTVHADRAFLRRKPYDQLIQHLHHRILDVSAIKEAARRWSSDEVLKNTPKKRGMHEAKADILESIEEARYYRDVLFKPK